MDPVLSKIFAVAAGLGTSAVLTYGALRLRNKFAGIDAAHDNISCGIRQSETHDKLHSIMEENPDVGSILLSTGEHAHIYINESQPKGLIHTGEKSDDVEIKHGTFFHNLEDSHYNYVLAQQDLLEPKKIYDRAVNPDDVDSSFVQRVVKDARQGAWANNKKRAALDVLFPSKKENSNREMLNQVAGFMQGMLERLNGWDKSEDYISGRDHVGVKYIGDDQKTHFVVMPANDFQHEVLDNLIVGKGEGRSGKGIEHPTDILEALSKAYEAKLIENGLIVEDDNPDVSDDLIAS